MLPASGRKASPDIAEGLTGDIIGQSLNWETSHNAGHKIETGNLPMATSERRPTSPRTAIALGTFRYGFAA